MIVRRHLEWLRPTRLRLTGLRTRLIAAFLAVALVSSVVASGIAYQLTRRAILQRTQDAQLTQVKNTLSRLVPNTVPPEVDLGGRIQGALETCGGTTQCRTVHVFQASPGIRLNLDEDPRLKGYVTGPFAAAAERRTVFRRVDVGGAPTLVIGARVRSLNAASAGPPERTRTPIIAFVMVPLDKEAADLAALARSVLIADALAVALALGLALAAARGVLRPVRRLGRAAQDLGEGRLDTRVAVTGRDELAALATTFNTTAEALEHTVAELRAMEAAARRFVADVSHELRTPLTAMTAVTDVLTEETAASADGGTASRLVVGQIRRLDVLVEHLLEISRLDAGTASLVLDDVPLIEVINASLSARGWSDEVTVEVLEDLIVRVDPRRLDVIIANLAGNAIKHGAPPVLIKATRAARDGVPGFTLAVTDQGPGIPNDLIALVFDRFVKADAARTQSEGSGLGLSIARANVELHGGSIEVSNASGGGAVFTVWLPVRKEQP